ncbi:UDP-N-acetylenolpyruvoylglucosamine reductase [Roseburia hominis]
MTKLRQDALSLLEEIPEDKLVFIIQIMEGVTGLYGQQEDKREKAFHTLERLRKSVPVSLDYEKELASYREEKYGNASVD